MDRDAVDVLLDQWAREKPDVDVSPMGVIGRVFRAHAVLSRGIGELFESLGMTIGEFDVMATLLRSGPPYRLTVGSLLGFTMVTGGAITNRLDRLESKGWVTRCPMEGNRRSKIVQLTDEGRAVVESALVAHVANEERLLSGLSREERDALADLLRRLLAEHGDVAGAPSAFPVKGR